MVQTLAAWAHKLVRAPAARDLLEQAQQAEAQARNFHAIVGAKLTTNGVPYIVHSHDGELFLFALTPELAHIEDALGATLYFTQAGHRRSNTEALPIRMHHLHIDGADGLKLGEPVRGRCSYKTRLPLQGAPCLQMTILLRSAGDRNDTRRVNLFHYPSSLTPEGSLEFQYPPLASVGADTWVASQQVAVAFLRFCVPPAPNQGQVTQPQSNLLADLLYLQ